MCVLQAAKQQASNQAAVAGLAAADADMADDAAASHLAVENEEPHAQTST